MGKKCKAWQQNRLFLSLYDTAKKSIFVAQISIYNVIIECVSKRILDQELKSFLASFVILGKLIHNSGIISALK